ncbi:MAG: hypothetical protein IJO91_09440 [Oscillospiraceae bacterium]|nr:hypothetical protein [Oscillospiraceae bacterium]
MANNNNKFDLKKIIIPAIVFILAIICGIVFMGDWDAFLGGADSSVTSGYSSIADSSDAKEESSLPAEITTAPTEDSKPQQTTSNAPPQTTTTPATTTTATTTTPATTTAPPEEPQEEPFEWFEFRNYSTYESHYEKHGHEFTHLFGEITMEEYLEHANELINSDADDILNKYDEDGDYMYFRKSTEEFLVLSKDGYIRTYFIPTAGIDYWNRQ